MTTRKHHHRATRRNVEAEHTSKYSKVEQI